VRIWEGRLRTALVLIPALSLFIAYSSSLLFFLLVAGGIGIAQHEFYRFFFRNRATRAIFVGLALGFLVVSSFYSRVETTASSLPDIILSLVILSLLLFQLFFHQNLQDTLVDTSVILLGVLYVGWLLGHLVLLRGLSHGRSFIFFLLLVTWAGDAGAYYFGKTMGRRKLYVGVSPNKTVAGAIGGWIVSLASALGSKFLFLPMLSVKDALLLGALLGIVGQIGDLAESMIKRSAGVKDSGSLVPSHGGLLDKVDSLAFNAPVLFYYLWLVKGYGYGPFTLTL